ncbi:MAG: Calx-beta domain-containing protein, partial [Nocardioidaceae bacterium]
VQFNAAAYTISEGATGAPPRATIAVTRTGGLASGVTVDYTTADGPSPTGATDGVDYVGTSGTLTFAANQTTATFTVDLVTPADALPEGNEIVILTLSNPRGGATLGPRSTAVLRILDDESTLQFSSVTYSITEGSSALITVERTGALTAGMSVDFATSDGTGVANTDYLPVAGTLVFGAGVATKTFSVPSTRNLVETANRTVNLTLSNATGGAVLGQAPSAVLTILENDEGGVVKLGAATYAVSEAAGFVTILVTRTNGAAGPVTVDYATSDVTATAGVDYTAVSGTLTFQAGQTLRSFTVPVISDTVEDGNKTFTATLSNVTGGATLGAPNPAVVTIVNNDEGGLVQFSLAVYDVTECIAQPCHVVLIVTRKGGSAGGVTVDYATSDGTGVNPAVAGLDYAATTGTVNLATGQLSTYIRIPLLDTEVGAEARKTFTVTLSNPRGGATIGPNITTTVRINDTR